MRIERCRGGGTYDGEGIALSSRRGSELSGPDAQRWGARSAGSDTQPPGGGAENVWGHLGGHCERCVGSQWLVYTVRRGAGDI